VTTNAALKLNKLTNAVSAESPHAAATAGMQAMMPVPTLCFGECQQRPHASKKPSFAAAAAAALILQAAYSLTHPFYLCCALIFLQPPTLKALSSASTPS
jgi:hypothetical protein